jgi:L-asparaginase type II
MKSRLFSLFLLLAVPVCAAASDLPHVLVLATGGTIAGEQADPGTLEGYEIRRPISELVSAVPEAKKYARIETEQFSNIPSPNISPAQWLQLARRINNLFKERPDLAGIVVTHGTARLDETAFFLHLAVKSDRPVVVVGAQRPPTGISPDGALNLLSGIRVAASPEARGKGTLVVMDERILSARDAEKMYARSGGFDAAEMGLLGIVATHGVEFFYAPARRHTLHTEFDLSVVSELPVVDIRYSYAGAGGSVVDENVKGIVVATTGFTPTERTFYENLQRRGIVVAATFPSGENVNSPSSPKEKDPGNVVAVERLTPLHARILLMMALTKTNDPKEIQRIFSEY